MEAYKGLSINKKINFKTHNLSAREGLYSVIEEADCQFACLGKVTETETESPLRSVVVTYFRKEEAGYLAMFG